MHAMPQKSDAQLPFFPAGFPDETIGSRVSRYHIRRGQPTMYATYKQLFGKLPFSLTGLVQQNLDKLAEKLPGSAQENLLEMQRSSTLLPLFQQFFGPKTATKHADRQGIPLVELSRRITGDSRLTHMCAQCLIDDEKEHGCPYIHRAHQIPGVTACWRHSTQLIDCCPSCGCPFAQPNQLILSAWMGCECGYSIADHAQSGQRAASNVEIEFAQFAQALLAASPRRLSIQQLINIYKDRAIEIGCQWGNSRVNHKMLFGKIEAHFGKELLATIDPAYKAGKTGHWLNIFCAHSAVEAPLTRHLMAAYFLFRDATLFLARADAIINTKPELGDPPHVLNSVPASSDKTEPEKQPEDELLEELVSLALRDNYDVQQLWRHYFGSMKRLVKLRPDAGEVIEKRLANAAAKKRQDEARAVRLRERSHRIDVEWSQAINKASLALYGENGRPVRVTQNQLLKTAEALTGSCRSYPTEPAFPLTVAALKTHEEGLWHFYARRLLWTLQCLHDPQTPIYKIVVHSKLETYKAKAVLEYFSDFTPCGGGSIQVIKSILRERGIEKGWQGPCPEREFYRAGRAYRLRTDRRGPIGGLAGESNLPTDV